MKPNVGKTDRALRIIIGLLMLSAFFWVENDMKYLGLIGLILIITAFIKFCPAYWLFKIRSCK